MEYNLMFWLTAFGLLVGVIGVLLQIGRQRLLAAWNHTVAFGEAAI